MHWHGGGGESCGDASNPDFTSTGGKAQIRIWDADKTGSVKWETLGTTINLGTSSSSAADVYAEHARIKSANFHAGHIVNNQIAINIKTWGKTVSDYKILEVIDYAKLNVIFEVPRVNTNAIPLANAGIDQRLREYSDVKLDASGSTVAVLIVMSPNFSAVSFNYAF
ncbi:MAG: hypothetical protein ACREAZ_03720 [Nitrososphaera sp.]